MRAFFQRVVHVELKLEFEREEDGRWIAEVSSIPGAMAYGSTKNEAGAKAEAIALRAIADRIEEDKAALELKVSIA